MLLKRWLPSMAEPNSMILPCHFLPMTQQNKDFSAFHPRDIDLLKRVMLLAELDGDTPLDREARAAALIRLFQNGLRSESELLSALGYSDTER